MIEIVLRWNAVVCAAWLVFALYGVLPLAAQPKADTANSSLLIGASMGAGTPSGVSSVRSMRMAVEEINAAGGIAGRPLRFIVHYGDAKIAETMDNSVQTLIDSGAVCVLSGSGSSNTLRAAQIGISKGILVMTGASSSPKISALQDNNLVWRTIPSDAFQAKVAAKAVIARLQSKKSKTVGIIHIDNAYGTSLAAAFAEAFKAQGGSVVRLVSYPDVRSYDTLNFQPILEKLYAAKPDAIYLVSYNDDGAQVVKQSQPFWRNGYKPVLMGCDGNYNNDFLLAVEPEWIEGMEGFAYVHPTNYANYDKFFAAFKQYSDSSTDSADLANISLANMLDVESTNSYAATSYDAVYIFALAALRTALAKRPLVASEIAKEMPFVSKASKNAVAVNVGEFAKAAELLKQGKSINYEGASGAVEFDQRGDVTSGTYVRWRVEQGKFKEIGTVAFP